MKEVPTRKWMLLNGAAVRFGSICIHRFVPRLTVTSTQKPPSRRQFLISIYMSRTVCRSEMERHSSPWKTSQATWWQEIMISHFRFSRATKFCNQYFLFAEKSRKKLRRVQQTTRIYGNFAVVEHCALGTGKWARVRVKHAKKYIK